MNAVGADNLNIIHFDAKKSCKFATEVWFFVKHCYIVIRKVSKLQ